MGPPWDFYHFYVKIYTTRETVAGCQGIYLVIRIRSRPVIATVVSLGKKLYSHYLSHPAVPSSPGKKKLLNREHIVHNITGCRNKTGYDVRYEIIIISIKTIRNFS